MDNKQEDTFESEWKAKLAAKTEPRTRDWKPYKPSKQMQEAAERARAYHALPSKIV